MMDHQITTPFGGGRFSARAVLIQKAVAERQERLKEAPGNETGRAEKWAVLSALTEARFAYGLGDRAIMVLEALLSFVPGRELDGSAPLIVFPSNRALSARARGMAPATIRRHLATLSTLGLIIRRDSPNGKRYRVKGEAGEADDAFGFDLAPLALRAGEIHEEAERARALHREERALRTRISLEQRDIGKILLAAIEEGRAGPFADLSLRFAAFATRLRRSGPLDVLKARLDDLVTLRAEVENAYVSSLSNEDMSAFDARYERHIQNSNTDHSFELNGNESDREEADGQEAIRDEDEAGTGIGKLEAARPLDAIAPERKSWPGPGIGTGGLAGAESGERADGVETGESASRGLPVTLERLLRACPTLLDYAPSGIRSPGDFLKTASLVRSMLGISPDAWTSAERALGREQAAAVIALMLERAEAIRSPGGYLRSLTRKAERGEFSLLPMLKAVEN